MEYKETIPKASGKLLAMSSPGTARQLALDLARIAPGQRQLLLRNSPRFAAEPLLSRELAHLAYSERFRDHLAMLDLAETAVKANGVGNPPPQMPAGMRFDIAAEVVAHHANALRVCGEFGKCEGGLQRARSLAERGSGDPCLAALLSAFEGSLAYGRRRYLTSAQMYRRAARLSGSVGEEHDRGRALIAAARAYAAGGRFIEAISNGTAGLSHIRVAREPTLALAGAQCLAFAVALDGRPGEALDLIERLGTLRSDHATTLIELKIAWLEGYCLNECGEYSSAVGLLQFAANEMVARGLEREASWAQLDLVTALAGIGAKESLNRVVSQLRGLLVRVKLPAEALAAHHMIQAAVEGGAVPVELARSAVRTASPARRGNS